MIQAAKYYPNSVGRALLDRAKQRVVRRKLKLARKHLERIRLRDQLGPHADLHQPPKSHHAVRKKLLDKYRLTSLFDVFYEIHLAFNRWKNRFVKKRKRGKIENPLRKCEEFLRIVLW